MHKVSVITSTWQRHDHLLKLVVPSVLHQDYPGEIEHWIVSDGPDTELAQKLYTTYGLASHIVVGDRIRSFRYVQLGRNWHQLTGLQSWGALPRLAATYLATGRYFAYLDDDNAYEPTHIRKLVELIEKTDADFVYSKFWDNRKKQVRGSAPPHRQQVDTSTILHKAELLARPDCQWRAAGYASDFDLVRRWTGGGGARWAHLEEPTLRYSLDV